MTVGEWLASRSPAAPVALIGRVHAALGPRLDDAVSTARDSCMAAAEELLATLLSGRNTGRESALDLLAADALVTYALERASESPESLEAWATGAMIRIAEVGTQHAAAAV